MSHLLDRLALSRIRAMSAPYSLRINGRDVVKLHPSGELEVANDLGETKRFPSGEWPDFIVLECPLTP